MTSQISKQIDIHPSNERFVLLDALRGIAALGVVLNHSIFANALSPLFESFLPAAFLLLPRISVSGVWIFFVISGFIIAHSLRNDPLTPLSVGRFILRRHTRLDPPYWGAILFFLLCTFLLSTLEISTEKAFSFPSIGTLLANMFYVQNITPPHQILLVAWTLCIEIQFYIFFIIVLYCGSFAHKKIDFLKNFSVISQASVVIFSVTLLSIACWATPLKHTKLSSAAIFLPYWYLFSSGVFLYWFYKKEIGFPLVLATFSLLTIATLSNLYATGKWGAFSPQITCILVFLLLYFAIKRQKLSSWLDVPIFRYFGKLSYSLYLIHLSIITLAFGFLNGKVSSPTLGILCYVIVMSGVVLASHLWWRWVELPSLNLASSLRKTPLPSTAPISAEPAIKRAIPSTSVAEKTIVAPTE